MRGCRSDQELLQEIVRTLNGRVSALEGEYLVNVDPHSKTYTVREVDDDGGGTEDAESSGNLVFLPTLNFRFRVGRSWKTGYMRYVFVVGFEGVFAQKDFLLKLSKDEGFQAFLSVEFHRTTPDPKTTINVQSIQLFLKPEVPDEEVIRGPCFAEYLEDLDRRHKVEVGIGADHPVKLFYEAVVWE